MTCRQQRCGQRLFVVRMRSPRRGGEVAHRSLHRHPAEFLLRPGDGGEGGSALLDRLRRAQFDDSTVCLQRFPGVRPRLFRVRGWPGLRPPAASAGRREAGHLRGPGHGLRFNSLVITRRFPIGGPKRVEALHLAGNVNDMFLAKQENQRQETFILPGR